MAVESDSLVLQYYYSKDGRSRRTSLSIDPYLFGKLADYLGSTEEARAQLRRWAIEEAKVVSDRASVSRRVHRKIYELLIE